MGARSSTSEAEVDERDAKEAGRYARDVVPERSGERTVEVRVELKPGVFDAEADGIAKSLRLLGIADLAGVDTARLYRLRFSGIGEEEARRRAERAVERLLANPVIHKVEVRTVAPDGA